ncbi:3-dehydroquinate dehydratase [Planctomycetes bacterium Pan216]|uniref:3-dehydroquinate dehydratase n=1 Tax=Kolteria novifilia TaxID=2527975 RepID=A0A518AYT9_9BACT|nr:3-dehydroquinate dehydratase [Planctomycetes bacterium Pan216]
MICVSIAQPSRRFALIDIINARGRCDFLEICLDRFVRRPSFTELFRAWNRPIIISCRRPRDGGQWKGDEDSRLALLHKAAAANADYVEIELDRVRDFRPENGAKLIVSHTDFDKNPSNLRQIWLQACENGADVVKLVLPNIALEEARRAIQILKEASRPTIIVARDEAGLMFSILGKRFGSPWAYAALEPGMESIPGMICVDDLRGALVIDDFGPKNQMVGVLGGQQEQLLAARILNQGFREGLLPIRAIPVTMGDNPEKFLRTAKRLPIQGILPSLEQRKLFAAHADHLDDIDPLNGSVDLLESSKGGWTGHDVMSKAIKRAFEKAFAERFPVENPIVGRPIIVLGSNSLAVSLALTLSRVGAEVSVVTKARDDLREIEGVISGGIYTLEEASDLTADALVRCTDEVKDLPAETVSKAGIAADFSNYPFATHRLHEFREEGGIVVDPIEIHHRVLLSVVQAYTGIKPNPDDVADSMAEWESDPAHPSLVE